MRDIKPRKITTSEIKKMDKGFKQDLKELDIPLSSLYVSNKSESWNKLLTDNFKGFIVLNVVSSQNLIYFSKVGEQ